MPGWKPPSRAASAVVLCLAAAAAQAAEPDGAATDADASPPTAALIEFLGEWEGEADDWQDPLEFDAPEWRALDADPERAYATD
jgi:hypothetical protein